MKRNKAAEAVVEYIEHMGLSQCAFANQAGLSKAELSHYLTGRRRPTLARAVAIDDATGGFVPARMWIE